MPSLSNRKAQFFIITSVIIVGVFYSLSKYITPYAFLDTSKGVESGEIFFFNNVEDKTEKLVKISNSTELSTNMREFESFVENMAADKGFELQYNYLVRPIEVVVNMTLISEKYVLKSDFSVPRP